MKYPSFPNIHARLFNALGLGLLLCASSAWAQTPLYNFTFSEGTGTAAVNSGSASSSNATLLGGSTWSAATATGFGSALNLSGTNGDYASASGAALNGLTAFTVTMWVNLSSTGTATNDRLLSNLSSSLGIDLIVSGFNTGTGNFTVNLGVNAVTAGAAAVAGKIDQWSFVAVRYNSTLATNNVAYFTGTTVAATAMLSNNANIVSQPTVGNGGSLLIGNTPANLARSPNGLFDDVRIYSTALNSTQIDDIRLENLTVIPEPSAFALISSVAVLFSTICVRRTKKHA
ncbi:MAG: LamG domain-containing protein [Opitutaceae bacterium]|nr:LamG domain-containing protein [Opitutaceae bacterium]